MSTAASSAVASVRCDSSMISSSLSVNAVHQECWNSPVHTGLSLPAMAWKPRKRRGSEACREKAPKGETLYHLGGQCKSYRVKAQRPEAQFGGVYTAAAA